MMPNEFGSFTVMAVLTSGRQIKQSNNSFGQSQGSLRAVSGQRRWRFQQIINP
jgi:hypothetical protein